MKTELRQNEKPVKAGAANMQRSIEAVGGKLYLTNERLVFEPHRMNIQREISEIRLSRIRGSSKGWTRLFGILPVLPNALVVHSTAGEEFRFVVHSPSAWTAAIDGAKEAEVSRQLRSARSWA